MILIIAALLGAIVLMIILTLVVDEKSHRDRTRSLVRIRTYWNGENRRRVVRHNATIDVEYSINHHMKPSKSRDISTHGLGLILDEKLERRMALSLIIRIQHAGDPIKAKARVMWSQEADEDERDSPKRLFHTGIKFIRFADARHEKQLFDYIRSITKDTEDSYGQLA